MTRRKFLGRIIRILISGALGYPVIVEPNLLSLEQVEVPIAHLPTGLNGLRIGLMADFHRGIYVTEGDIMSAVDLLQEQKPELILLAGDFVEGDAKYIHSVAPILSKLEAPLGTYAVLGNHDYWTNPEIIKTVLHQFNVPVLLNESVELKRNGDSLFLLGLDDAWEGRPDHRKVLSAIPERALKILLVHEPDYADFIRSYDSWIPLQLSGHSHGGQVVVPFIGIPYLPHLAKSYPMGLKRVSDIDRWVYTTRGVGLTLPVRFNCKPEVTLLTLRRKELES